MKSILKYTITVVLMFTFFTLVGCGRQTTLDVTLDNGNEVAIELDGIRITNQELLELIITGQANPLNPGVALILDWVDIIILPSIVEIDEALLDTTIDFLEALSDDELENILTINGFANVDEVLQSERLRLMREQAVRDSIVYTEEDLYAIYTEHFVPSSDDDYDDDDEEDVPTFEEVRDSIESFLINERLEIPGYIESVLAGFRTDAGMVIYSDYFAAHYTNFLNAQSREEVTFTIGTGNTAVASVNNQYFTLDEFFNVAIARFAFSTHSPLLDHINLQVLDAYYSVSRRTINEIITQTKLELLEWFYPQMEWMGLTTEEAIFNWFKLSHLQTLAFNDHVILDDARVEYLQVNFPRDRDTYHILVDDYDFATELIEQLLAVSEDELLELFNELAIEYSTCGSASSGGSLGRLSIPSQMVAAFEEATFALNEDSFSLTPVETQFGYHIIYVENFSSLPALSVIREQELNRLRSTPRYLENVMFNLRAELNITFNNDTLRDIYNALAESNRQSIEN